MGNNKWKKLTKAELLFCILLTAYFILWIFKPLNFGPDEHMRYQVSQFFFEHNRLPIGGEIREQNWGFSYALLPTMLCNILDYIPMKIVSVFTSNETALLYSARMVSVLAGGFSVFFFMKAFKLFFKSEAGVIAAVFIGTIPQLAFLSSYVNNDILAMLGSSVILYAWVLAKEDKWNYKNSAVLCIGMSICALSYYNSYVWILLSIFYYFVTFFIQYGKDYKKLWKLTLFIIGLTFVLSGYVFVRHIVLYKDLLGLNTMRKYGEKYAIEELKPSNRGNPANQGISLIDMLRGELYGLQWITTSIRSFVGCFGPMKHYLSIRSYFAYYFVICFGAVSSLPSIYKMFSKKQCEKSLIIWAMLFVSIGAVCLSIYYSYFKDFQPQGRYFFSALPFVGAIVGYGCYEFTDKFCGKYKKATVIAICVLLVLLNIHTYKYYYLHNF